MSKYESFLSDLKTLCDKHGIYIRNPYDEPIDLVNTEDERIAEYVNFEDYTAYPYKPREYKPSPKTALSDDTHILLKEVYGPEIVKELNENSLFLQMLQARK